MKRFASIIAFAGLLLLPAGLLAQEKSSLAISSIKATPSLTASLKPEKKLELGRIEESLDSQLEDRINATRKFQIVSRSDLNDVLKEQDLGASGNVDAKTAAKTGQLAGAKYLLVATVDNFQDDLETATFEAIGQSATRRMFNFSITAKVYDSTTGKLLESANIHTEPGEFKQIQVQNNYVVKDGELSDEMMGAISRTMAGKIANYLADVIFPAKILIRRDSLVTINRGEGTGVTAGDIFNVFALGEEMIDPDTKESLGREEANVGRVKISEVDPKFSKADILEDTGIAAGCILRKAK